MRGTIKTAFTGPGFAADAIKMVQPDGKAQLYRTAADWGEAIRGLNNPDKSETYTVRMERSGDRWTLAFKDAPGNGGTIAITLPEAFEYFFADMRPGDVTKIDDVRLYKEIRVAGAFHGTGMFALKTRGRVRAEFIFHGHGSGCTFPDQLHHWTLTVRGPGARYRFFGKLQEKKS